MIEQVTVDQIYARRGFYDLIAEYGELSNPLMPPPASADDQKQTYLMLEKAGMLAVYCVMDGGLAVGFATCVKSRLPHYGATVAIVDSIYLRRAHRAKDYGQQLLDACEDYARIQGLQYVFIQVHEEELKRLGIILERRTYSACFYTYGRRL